MTPPGKMAAERSYAMENNTNKEVNIAGIDLHQLLTDGLRTMRQTLLLFIAALAVCTGLLCWRTYRTYRPMYRASATFTVYVANPLQSEIRSYNTATAEQMAKTFPYILTSGALNDRVMRELGISAMPAVSASVLNNTNIFTLTVTSSDPQLAYNVLNAVIENYPDVAEFVVGPTVMNLLDESGLPSVPYNTRSYRGAVKKSVLVCTALWLLVCIVFAALRSTVHGEDELKQILNLPTLGVLPLVRSRKKSERALCLQPEAHSGFSEAVQLMRIRVQKKMRESGMKVLLVSSASPGEGKTTVAINLAEALAGGGARVLLVDCDLRNPSVARALGLENKDGLAEYLRGETSYQKIVRQAQTKGLYLVLAGKPDANAAELLTRPACRPFFDACRTVFDYVILDTPPAALLADAAEVAVSADCALLTIRQNYAPKRKILECAQILSDSKLPVIGCVINYAPGRHASGGYYGYGYGYGYGSRRAQASGDAPTAGA